MKQMRLIHDHPLNLFNTHVVVIPKGTIVDVVIEDVVDCEVIVQTGNSKVSAWIEHTELQPVRYYHLVYNTINYKQDGISEELIGNQTKEAVEESISNRLLARNIGEEPETVVTDFKDCVIITTTWSTTTPI